MEAPIPVQHARGFDIGDSRPRGLVRKNSKLQTHVEVLRCRLGKPNAIPESGSTLGPTKDWTPIYYAVYHQREAALTHFLRTGGSPDEVDGTGQPPLCIATTIGNVDVVKILLDAGANVDATTSDGETALHLAIKNSHTDIIEVLLETGPELEAHTTDTNETPLHYAASKSGSLATIVSLLRLGARYDSSNSRGQSPAEAALLANNIQGAVAIINSAHGKRNKLAKEKELLLKHVERSQGRFSLSNELIADIFAAACDPDSTVLVEAVKRNDAGLVEMFLSKGADPDRATAKGDRPIFVALECAAAPVVQVLVKHKADLAVREAKGYSVLQAAFEGSFAQDKDSMSAVFDCLLSNGADATVTYPDGTTLLHRAVSSQFGYFKIAQRLLSSKVRADALDGDGNTALHLATHSRPCIDVLLKNGANAHQKNRDNLIPLLYAITHAKKEDEPDLEPLIKVSDLRRSGANGQTALHLAAMNGLTKTIRLLLRARAETAIVDAKNRTPLLLAVLSHQWHVVPLLTIPPSINSWDESGRTALHHIATSIPKSPSKWQDIAGAAKPFCERGVSRSMRDRSGATPLILAVKEQSEEGMPVIDMLLMQKMDRRASWNCVGHEDHDGHDALYYAISLRKAKFVEALLKNGAMFSLKEWVPGKGTLDASSESDRNISKLLAQHEWARRASVVRRQSAGPEMEGQRSQFVIMFPMQDLRNMITMGLSPNALPKTSLGSSLLWALLRQIPLQPPLPPKYLFDALHLILEHRADPNVGTARGGRRTPSPQASAQDLPLTLHTLTFLLEEYPTVDADLVTLLLTKGTKLSLASPFYGGRYPLHSAAKANRIDLVDEFVLQRADINCVDLEGRSPLFLAAEKGFWEIAEALLNRGARLDLKDTEGNTVLHAAAVGGSPRIVSKMLRAGCKAGAFNAKKQTPLHRVPENLDAKEKDKIVHLLKSVEDREKADARHTVHVKKEAIVHEVKTKQKLDDEVKIEMKQKQIDEAKAKQQRELALKERQREQQMAQAQQQQAQEQQLKTTEKPRQVSAPLPTNAPSKLSKFRRTASFLHSRSKPRPAPPAPFPMPKLELNLRVTTPPSSKHLTSVTTEIKSAKDLKEPNTTTITTTALPSTKTAVVASAKHAPSPRIDSGFGQKRPGDTDKPLPVLDRNKVTLEGKDDKRNSSAAELADWLALSKMMDNI